MLKEDLEQIFLLFLKTTSLDNKLQEASKGADLEFPSLTSCIQYFKSIGLATKRDTLSKYLKSGKEFLGYTVEFVDTNAPIDSPYLDELLAEYNNRVEESTNVQVNKKKAILVKCLSDGSMLEFPSIMDSVRYFDTTLRPLAH